MRSETAYGKSAAVLVALAIMGIAIVGLAASLSADPPEYDQDMGSFNSMSCRFIYTGEGADVVTWDFGDGTEPISGMNVDHTYAATGVYIVTQTSTNDIGSTVAKYRVEILGYPVVTYDLGYDNQKIVVTQDVYNIPTKTITDPSRTGYTFAGWYADSACTMPYDFSAENKLTAPVTIFAKWTLVGVTPDPGDTDPEPVAGTDIVPALLGIGAIVALLTAAYTRSPIAVLIAAILVAIVALQYFGVLSLPVVNVDLNSIIPEVSL